MAKKQNTQSAKPETISCSNCGMAEADWPDEGYSVGSRKYCCQGCAEDTGCTCGEADRATA
jgi:hypothetical protein